MAHQFLLLSLCSCLNAKAEKYIRFCLFFMTNQEIYDISDDAFHWFLGTCGKKWKEVKSTLKKQFFNEKITNAQLKAMHAGRVNDDDWKFLANYWRSPDCEVCWI